jgi:hypothetical protein
MKIRKDMADSTGISSVTYPVPYLWALLLIIVTVGGYIALENSSDLVNIQNNWGEYRCQPQFMLLAGLFGQDVNENFQFCIQQIIQDSTKGVTGPFVQGMGGFTTILMNLMNSANSFRTMLATLLGGIVKIIQEFKARMTALMSRIKITASRMRAMMYRIYGTMFAVIYMGMSAQTGIANFGDTFIFKFIDAFCFPPEQIIELYDDSGIRIIDIEVGDILKGGHRVTTIYRFAADGQSMVTLDNVTVSSNHFVRHGSKWILAKDHPDALEALDWDGGIERPLICLSTDTHKIPIEKYMFADYDETDEGNISTQEWVAGCLNGTVSGTVSGTVGGTVRRSTPHPDTSYEVGSPSSTRIKTLRGLVKLSDIKLGDMITERSKVVGIQISSDTEFCRLPDGQYISRGALLWSMERGQWLRAYTMYPIDMLSKEIQTIALFVSPGAQYELEGGYIVRDAMEVYSPDTKRSYAEALTKARLD